MAKLGYSDNTSSPEEHGAENPNISYNNFSAVGWNLHN